MKFDHQKGHMMTSGDADLYVEELGDPHAPVLIMLHGGFGTIEDFNGLTPHLGRVFRLIGIDTRGHGRSTLGTQPLTYERGADDLAAVIDELGLTQYSLLGFSDGGIIGYRYAARQDPRLHKLMTIGANWELNSQSPEWAIYSAMSGSAWKNRFPDSYQRYMALNPQADWDRFSDSVITRWTHLGPDGYPFEQMRQIKIETLAVLGDEDPLLPASSIATLRTMMERIHFFNIPFAGHVAFDDQPELFLKGLALFLGFDLHDSGCFPLWRE